MNIWASLCVSMRRHGYFFFFCISFLTALKKKHFCLCAPSGTTRRGVKTYRFCPVLHARRPPSIHYLWISIVCFCSVATPTCSLNRERERKKKGRKKGTLICMRGASLDKAEDNKECILSHSDESLLHPKVTSKWAPPRPSSAFLPAFLHIYLFIHLMVELWLFSLETSASIIEKRSQV